MSNEAVTRPAVGDRFVSLTVEGFERITRTKTRLGRRVQHHEFYARCRCDCGKRSLVAPHNLRRGVTTTCGHGRGRRPKS